MRIPESFKKIPDRAFYNAKRLKEVYIPDTIRSNGEYFCCRIAPEPYGHRVKLLINLKSA